MSGLEQWNGELRAGQYLHMRNTCKILLCVRRHTTLKPQHNVPRGWLTKTAECSSSAVEMTLECSSRNNPIYLLDSSPITVPASPVKLLMEEKKRDKYRYVGAFILVKG